MADGPKRSYVFDAFGLILLYAVAMAGIAIPFRWLMQTNNPTPPVRVQAQQNGK